MGVFDKYTSTIKRIDPIKYTGTVSRVQGLLIESSGPVSVVGELCQIAIQSRKQAIWAEVVGLRGKTVQLMPYDEMEGIEVGCPVIAMGEPLMAPVSDKLLGRVLNGMGRPVDRKGEMSPLLLKGEIIGYWLRTKYGVRPLAVHGAWRTTPETAAVVLATTGRARTPEPIRLARQLARAERASARWDW